MSAPEKIELTEEEIAEVLEKRKLQTGDTPPTPLFTGEQVEILRCIDSINVIRELYIPQESILQSRLAYTQYLLQMYGGFASPEPDAEEPEAEVEEPTNPEPDKKGKGKPYTVG